MQTLTAEYVRSRLSYCPLSGTLRWRPNEARGKGWNARYAGRVTGSRDHTGYLRVSIGARLHLAHRLAWLIVHGEWPATHLDHINGDPADNRLINLRLATRAQNNQNAATRHDNKHGKGVWKIGNRFAAACSVNGERIYLGCFSTPVEAKAAYEKFARLSHGEFFAGQRAQQLAREAGKTTPGGSPAFPRGNYHGS